MIALRDYQRAAIDAIYGYFAENGGNPLVVIPTAGGKSLIMAEFLRGMFADWPDQRVLVLTHVKELIAQNYGELLGLWPDAPAGIYSAGLNRRDLGSRIIFGGIQSIHRHAYSLQRVDLVLVDEAHLIPRRAGTLYRKFLNDLREINPYLKIIGLTATPFRLDSGMLHSGDDALFSDIAYEVNVTQLIDRGFLTTPISMPGAAQIDTATVGTRQGEFAASELEAVATDPDTVRRIVDEVLAAGTNRKGWLVFGCGVAHCRMLHAELWGRGIAAGAIFGHTPGAERDLIISRFKRRELRALVSMGVLTTGFNARHVDLIAVARPTKSTGLWVQIVGRGMRLSPETGKVDCLVLDFGGNIERHGPIDKPRPKGGASNGDSDGTAPVKTCPRCAAATPIGAAECSGCGYVFPPSQQIISTKASDQALLSRHVPIEWLDVAETSYARHEKPDKPPSLRVDYRCGLITHREWVCLEHTGYPRQKAAMWWVKRAPGCPVPNTIEEALANAHALGKPVQIAVKPAGRFVEVVGAKFG